MSVPKQNEILLPLFKILRENDVIYSNREAANLVALRMNLTEEDKNVGTEKSNTFLTNVSFASSALKKEGIMVAPKIGVWQITEKGKKISIKEFCELFKISDQFIEKKTGEEFFYLKNVRLDFQLKDFWSWN